MSIILMSSLCFAGFYFVPKPIQPGLVDTSTSTFWTFVILMSLGTIGFNVANCVSDAVCFDVLDNQEMKYGRQRVWGTIGFGLTALIGGIVMNTANQDIGPALLVMLIATVFDLGSVTQLKVGREPKTSLANF